MENMIIPAAVFAFVFVSLVVGGMRVLRMIEERKAKEEAERLERMNRRAKRVEYTGPIYSQFGNEIN